MAEQQQLGKALHRLRLAGERETFECLGASSVARLTSTPPRAQSVGRSADVGSAAGATLVFFQGCAITSVPAPSWFRPRFRGIASPRPRPRAIAESGPLPAGPCIRVPDSDPAPRTAGVAVGVGVRNRIRDSVSPPGSGGSFPPVSACPCPAAGPFVAGLRSNGMGREWVGGRGNEENGGRRDKIGDCSLVPLEQRRGAARRNECIGRIAAASEREMGTGRRERGEEWRRRRSCNWHVAQAPCCACAGLASESP
jgi:hypothetical protein